MCWNEVQNEEFCGLLILKSVKGFREQECESLTCEWRLAIYKKVSLLIQSIDSIILIIYVLYVSTSNFV